MKRKLLKKMLPGFMILSIVLGQLAFVAPTFAQDKASLKEVALSNKTGSVNDIVPSDVKTAKNGATDSKKAGLSATKKKLSTDLLKLSDENFLMPGESRANVVADMKKLEQYVAQTDTARANMRNRSVNRGDLVYTYIQLKESAATSAIDSNVWEVTGRDEKNHLAVAYVEVSKLETLSALSEVESVRTVTPPHVRKGSVTAEGDVVHKTSDVRTTYSQQGNGVKIGVISDGVDSIAAAKASGDLPANVTVLSNTQGGDEGTAMLEIAYDMAPGASLYFHDCGDDMVSFNAAVDELVAAGCQIIVDDMGWDEEAFFEEGVIGSHIASIIATKDVVFVAAAGNEADVHYQGTFYNDDDYPGYQDFSRGTQSTDKCLYVDLPDGEDLDVILQWNDRFGQSGNDYDLELVEAGSLDPLEKSTETQDGNDDPLEMVYYTNDTGRDITVEINVYRYDAAEAKTLELYIWPSDGEVSSRNIVAADSIWGHPNVKGVMAVGAIDAEDSGYDTIEYYSSRGPITIIGEAQRSKPDIIGLDNVSVSGVGDFGSTFPGTSASAPAIGAIVAQLWGAFPTLKVTQIRDAILASAVDLGSSGYDYTYGYGRADALRAYQLLSSNNPTKSSEKAITSFTLSGQTGVINGSNHTITVNLPAGTSVTSLAPGISISAKASISPASGAVRNFSSPLTYTVTAEDGSTQVYTVTVVVAAAALSSAKAITGFTLGGKTGTINESNHTITVNLAAGTVVTSLISNIFISAKASISPASGVARNFSSPVTYTVTAEDGSTQAYTVTAIVANGSNPTDNSAPVITLNGNSFISLVTGSSYSEQGATATDNIDGSVTVLATGAVNTNTPGTYAVTYTATDAAGNVATVVRTIEVSASGDTINSGNSITSFRFTALDPTVNGIIDATNHKILATVPYGTNVTSLVPTISISAGASVSPQSATSQNFSVPKTYTVTSNSGVSQSYIVTVKIAAQGQTRPAVPAGIIDGDIIQCKTSADPNAVYIVKIVGKNAYIRHIVSLQIFNYYKHLKWENLKQVGSLDPFSLSGWVRVNTGANGTPRDSDKVWEVNGDQTRHWINMTAQQFLTHGGSDEAIYTINQGELNLYAIGPDVMSL